jgi:hypothetical protein
MLNEEKLKAFPEKSGMRQGGPPSPLLFNTVFENLARTISQEKKKTQMIQIEKEKMSLFANCMILY